MSKPQSTIYICSGVPLDSRYEHTILFESVEKQVEYFTSKRVKTFSDYTYIRKSWDLKVSGDFESARKWNYLFFRNSDTSKYYFYFINQIEYENNGMVKLSLELDVLQTYMKDFSLSPCFIERAHTTSDNVGEHTVDEGLDTGELVNRATEDVTDLNDLCILVYSTFDPNSYNENTKKYVDWNASYYGNVFSGLGIFTVNPVDAIKFSEKLTEFSARGYIDGIVNMFMYPRNMVTLGEVTSSQQHTWGDGIVCKYVKNVKTLSKTITKQTTIGNHTIKNKKLLCYPYNVLYVTNNAGTAATYKYERFIYDNECEFKMCGCYSPEGSVKLVPRNYDGVVDNYEEGFSLGSFPTCAWNSDMYKVWLAQNQGSLASSAGTAALSIVGGVGAIALAPFTGGVSLAVGGIMAAGSGAMSVFSMLAADQDRQIQPLQSRGAHSPSVNISYGKQTFSFYKKTVTEERAKIIDDYFTRYGYKIMRVQTPNLAARPHFTYIKTIGAHVVGEFCNEDRLKLEAIFDNGITVWKNPGEVCNFSVDNSPV